MSDRKVCLVTGSGSGNGRGMALRIAQEGYDMAIHHSGRDAEGAESVAKMIREQYGVRAEVFAVSFMEDGAAKKLFDQFREKFDRLDLFVANSGVTKGALLSDLNEEVFDMIYKINWKGTYFSVAEAARFMVEKGIQGSIAMIASNHHLNNWHRMAAYGSNKQAMVKFAKYCGLEFAQYGIRANVIAPGYIDPDYEKRPGFNEMRDRIALEKIPMKRFVTASELAEWALFLASPAGASYTGDTVDIDGGAFLKDGPMSNYGL